MVHLLWQSQVGSLTVTNDLIVLMIADYCPVA